MANMTNTWMVYTVDEANEIGQVIATGSYKNEALMRAENHFILLAKKEMNEEKADLHWWIADALQQIQGTDSNSVSIDYNEAIRVSQFTYNKEN